MEIKIRRKLYKYEDTKSYGLENLKNFQLYFAPPISFNDPFDCSLFVNGLKITEEKILETFENAYQYMRKNYLKKFSIIDRFKANDFLEQNKTQKYSTLKEKKDYLLKQLTEKTIMVNSHIQEKLGVVCFSQLKNDILMWGHYSDGHRGFCIEFDTNFFLKEGKVEFCKIIYSQAFPVFFPEKIINAEYLKPKSLEVYTPIFTKSTQWEYEAEWRMIYKNAKFKYSYPPETINKIYFGAQMEDSDKEKIINIFKNKTHQPKFIQAKLSKKKYEIEFEDYK